MGAVLVSVAGLGTAAAAYALSIALHLPWPLALVGGAVWGVIILNLDRWLVVSRPRLHSRTARWPWRSRACSSPS